MTRGRSALPGVLLMTLAVTPHAAHADTVEFSLHDGCVTLIADNATPTEIFDAWSRAGGVTIVNSERMPAVRLTLRLDGVTEEGALDTVLRSVSGYLARRRTAPGDAGASAFDRIVILASAPAPNAAVSAAPAPVNRAPTPGAAPVFPGPSAQPGAQPAAGLQQGIPQAPGVTRRIGADGQPMDDDQQDAPPPAVTPRTTAPVAPQPFVTPRPAPVTPPSPAPGAAAPVGAPAPGMIVPAPAPQGGARPDQR